MMMNWPVPEKDDTAIREKLYAEQANKDARLAELAHKDIGDISSTLRHRFPELIENDPDGNILKQEVAHALSAYSRKLNRRDIFSTNSNGESSLLPYTDRIWSQVPARIENDGILGLPAASAETRLKVMRRTATALMGLAGISLVLLFVAIVTPGIDAPDIFAELDPHVTSTLSILLRFSPFLFVGVSLAVAKLEENKTYSSRLVTRDVLPSLTHSVARTQLANGTLDPSKLAKTELGPAPKPDPSDEETSSPTQQADLESRIRAVRETLELLDREWLNYTLDLDAYFLVKPLLRDREVAATKRYNEALYELREVETELSPNSSKEDVTRAEGLADEALKAWNDANDHAEVVGVSDRTPVERVALRRVRGLIAQLENQETPREMYPNLVKTITRELAKLTTVPVPIDYLQTVPSLASRVALSLEMAKKTE